MVNPKGLTCLLGNCTDLPMAFVLTNLSHRISPSRFVAMTGQSRSQAPLVYVEEYEFTMHERPA